MDKTLKTVDILMEGFERGLIYIDESGYIRAYNRLAKEITGIILKSNHTHPKGTINVGDIVIIADNDIGNDDELSPDDLKLLGIDDKYIKTGSAIIVIGVYKNKKIAPLYKSVYNYNPNGTLAISTVYLGFKIKAEIDFSQKSIAIMVNGEPYEMHYMDAIGHMVVIDGTTGEIKFFQDIGYGFRNEEIGRLIAGKEYMPKQGSGKDDGLVATTDVKYNELLFGDEIRMVITEMLDANEPGVKKGIFEVHKRAMFCTFVRIVDSESVSGLFMIIQNASMMEKNFEDRSKMIRDMELNRRGYKISLPFDEERGIGDDLIGNTPAMNEVKRLAIKASQAKFHVLITGESGTGKTRLAKIIHDIQDPASPFVEVNCNAIAPTLLESELFGYVGGAFTGASPGGKAGYFEEADGGTIFFDEIGDMPLDVQVKLLQVLQSKQIYRVGSSKPIEVNVRVITATNKDLEEQVKRGKFRQDLYYRVNVFPIVLPPLRERKSDLYILINTLLQKTCERYDMETKQLSEGALSKMIDYEWPGNVRELENVIERAVIICDSHIIYSEHITINSEFDLCGMTFKERLHHEEIRIINDALVKNNYDKTKTALELGMSRSALYEKMKETEKSKILE